MQTKTRSLCLLLGFVYVTLIGFGKIGINLQATVFHLAFFVLLSFLAKNRGIKLVSYHYILLGLGATISIFFSITTNTLVTSLSYLTVGLLTSIWLLLLFEKQSPDTPIAYIQDFLRYFIYSVTNGLSLNLIKQFTKIENTKIHWRPKKETLYGLLVTIPILLIFHILFVRINSEYAIFMYRVWQEIWRIIRYILDIEILWILIKSIITGYFFFVLVTVEHTDANDKTIQTHWPLTIFKILLTGIIGLFFIFSSFQSKLLFLDIFHLAFKEVSQYVQKGFAELILVSVVGYAISIFTLHRIPQDSSKTRTIRWLLACFCVELIAITVFIFHKLYALQAVFGFKDQRILATSATVLILVTFVLLLGRIGKKLSSAQIFRSQIILLASITLLLQLLNVDWFISRYNSIRYSANAKIYKDYSYLLGNSYDNTSEWLGLMREAMESQIPAPDQDYYWGHFSSSRVDFYRSRYSPLCEEEPYSYLSTNHVYHSYLEDRYRWLYEKYDVFNLKKMKLTKLTTFNLHEYQAYKLIKQNKALVDAFVDYAKNTCKENGKREITPPVRL